MSSLGGKTVLIFGGSSGMGKAAALGVAKRGGTPFIVGRDLAKLEAAAAAIGGGCKTASVDMMDDEAMGKFFEGIEAGSIHHLVNTAGASAGCSSILGADGLKGLKKQFDFKFFAQLAPVSFGAEKLADGGSIVLTTGALATRPGKGSTALGAANAALDAIVKGLANDLGPRLRVNTVSPGLTNTEMWANMPEAARKGMLEGFGSKLPLGRSGESEDVGEAICFLLENNYVTGTVLDVDGGAKVRQ